MLLFCLCNAVTLSSIGGIILDIFNKDFACILISVIVIVARINKDVVIIQKVVQVCFLA